MIAQAENMTEDVPARRGVKTKLIGFVVMALGTMNCLLTLRGGVPAYEFLLMVGAGAVIFAIGTVRGMRKTAPEQPE
ncbi:MAG: hypothetical protein OEV35_01450 [Gallionellaceae bacterium]|nr:hypothetical protein [Gallionellaceae bacterium]